MEQKEAEAWKRAAQSLLPSKPKEDGSDGPCCYELRDYTGKMRWTGTGCDCGNYDGAQHAASWADDMNHWLDAQDIMEREGLPCPGMEIEPGVFSGCDQSAGDCPTCGR